MPTLIWVKQKISYCVYLSSVSKDVGAPRGHRAYPALVGWRRASQACRQPLSKHESRQYLPIHLAFLLPWFPCFSPLTTVCPQCIKHCICYSSLNAFRYGWAILSNGKLRKFPSSAQLSRAVKALLGPSLCISRTLKVLCRKINILLVIVDCSIQWELQIEDINVNSAFMNHVYM